MPHQIITISLLPTAVRIGDQQIDILATDAAPKLRECLGPKIASHSFPGTARTAELLRGGAILVTENGGTQLLLLTICFDAQDGSPYSAFIETPVFSGAVECAGHRFLGQEKERAMRRQASIHGFAGALKIDVGEIHIGLWFRKPKNRFGKRSGERRLVSLSVEWGHVKGFGNTSPAPLPIRASGRNIEE